MEDIEHRVRFLGLLLWILVWALATSRQEQLRMEERERIQGSTYNTARWNSNLRSFRKCLKAALHNDENTHRSRPSAT